MFKLSSLCKWEDEVISTTKQGGHFLQRRDFNQPSHFLPNREQRILIPVEYVEIVDAVENVM